MSVLQSSTAWWYAKLLVNILVDWLADDFLGWLADVFFSPTTLLSTFQVNKELFHPVYDMIAVLLHHTLGGDKQEYLNIIKKINVSLAMAQYKPLFMRLLLTERNRGAAEQKSDPFASVAAHSTPGSLCFLL